MLHETIGNLHQIETDPITETTACLSLLLESATNLLTLHSRDNELIQTINPGIVSYRGMSIRNGIVMLFEDRTQIKFWNVYSNKSVAQWKINRINDCKFSCNGLNVLSTEREYLCAYSTETGQLQSKIKIQQNESFVPTSVRPLYDNDTVLTFNEANVGIWDFRQPTSAARVDIVNHCLYTSKLCVGENTFYHYSKLFDHFETFEIRSGKTMKTPLTCKIKQLQWTPFRLLSLSDVPSSMAYQIDPLTSTVTEMPLYGEFMCCMTASPSLLAYVVEEPDETTSLVIHDYSRISNKRRKF